MLYLKISAGAFIGFFLLIFIISRIKVANDTADRQVPDWIPVTQIILGLNLMISGIVAIFSK